MSESITLQPADTRALLSAVDLQAVKAHALQQMDGREASPMSEARAARMTSHQWREAFQQAMAAISRELQRSMREDTDGSETIANLMNRAYDFQGWAVLACGGGVGNAPKVVREKLRGELAYVWACIERYILACLDEAEGRIRVVYQEGVDASMRLVDQAQADSTQERRRADGLERRVTGFEAELVQALAAQRVELEGRAEVQRLAVEREVRDMQEQAAQDRARLQRRLDSERTAADLACTQLEDAEAELRALRAQLAAVTGERDDLAARLSAAQAQLLTGVLGGPQLPQRSKYSDTPAPESPELSDTAEEAPMPKKLQPDAVHVTSALEGMSLAAYATRHGVPSRYHQNERAVITSEDGADLAPIVEGWRRDVHDHRAYLRGLLALKSGKVA